jgi:hypothetical protein
VLSDRLLFLSDARPFAIEQTPAFNRTWPMLMDAGPGGVPLRVGGKTFEKGLHMIPRTRVTYSLKGRYRTFSAVIGLLDDHSELGDAAITVLADGRTLFELDHLTAKDGTRELVLDIHDVDKLVLEVGFASGLDVGDHCVWADARVLAPEDK